ncbi:MAG: hypothetical protein ACRD0P_31450 [Stackebrandtia sp.]
MRIRSLCASVLLGAAVLLTTGSPAQAIPGGCTISNSGTTYSSNCTSGTGEHRIAVWVKFLTSATYHTFHGPWAPVGGTSTTQASCGCTVQSFWTEKR